RVLIGEIYLPVQQLMTYYGRDLTGAHLPFNFLLLQCAWNAQSIAQVLSDYQRALPQGAWPNWVLGNHDNARIATRIGLRQARVAAMLLLTLPGTLTMYYGEEIGMTNAPISPDQVLDNAEKNEPGLGLGRDPERTPMPWDGSASAGFTTGAPWLPLGDDYKTVNVAALGQDPRSILQLYRKLIGLRRGRPTLVNGKVQSVAAENGVLRFVRIGSNDRILVLLNMGMDVAQITLDGGTVLASTSLDREGETVSGTLEMKSSDGLAIDLP